MWYSCVGRVLQSFPDIANRYYVKYFFDDSSRSAVRELIDNVRDAFSDLIWENTWMDAETKNAADRKVFIQTYSLQRKSLGISLNARTFKGLISCMPCSKIAKILPTYVELCGTLIWE